MKQATFLSVTSGGSVGLITSGSVLLPWHTPREQPVPAVGAAPGWLRSTCPVRMGRICSANTPRLKLSGVGQAAPLGGVALAFDLAVWIQPRIACPCVGVTSADLPAAWRLIAC